MLILYIDLLMFLTRLPKHFILDVCASPVIVSIAYIENKYVVKT